MKFKLLPLTIILANISVFAQAPQGDEIVGFYQKESSPCISTENYEQIIKSSNENVVKFGVKHQIQYKGLATEKLGWPIQNAKDFGDCESYIITNFVDLDKTTGVKDYHCGKRTYDGHRGTDISLWPYPQFKQEHALVEVVAAKTGVIVNKADGFFDKKCVGSDGSGGGNYVVLQHTDGTRTLYYHMKKNSITTKAIGATIEKGEYLGTVASSGSSGIPHLHFEVWSDTKGTVTDPFLGECNSLADGSLWIEQKPYLEPAISKVSLHTAKPVTPACPGIETLNESRIFSIDDYEALFYIHRRDEEIGVPVDMSIKNPDGSIFSNWSSKGTTTWNGITRSWLKELPKTPGIYTFEAKLYDKTCSSTFEMRATLGTNNFTLNNPFSLSPNPTKGDFVLEMKNGFEGSFIEIFNSLGQKVFGESVKGAISQFELNVNQGVYFYKIHNGHEILGNGKLIIE